MLYRSVHTCMDFTKFLVPWPAPPQGGGGCVLGMFDLSGEEVPQPANKPMSIKDSGCRSGGCEPKAAELTPGVSQPWWNGNARKESAAQDAPRKFADTLHSCSLLDAHRSPRASLALGCQAVLRLS
jgi:hypothetical protein